MEKGCLHPVNETAARLIQLRKERGLTQKDIAKAAGVDLKNYCAWENGTRRKTVCGETSPQPVEMRGKNIVALADFYGVSADYLLGRTPYASIDGAAIAARTALSDAAIAILEKYNGLDYCTAAGDASRILQDFERHGENSLLHALHQYAQALPDTSFQINTNTGRPTGGGLYGADIPLSGALLYVAVQAIEQFKADLQADKKPGKAVSK